MNRREHGLFIVEFAIMAVGMFVLIFAVIELARLIWVWNTIDEATRRGARVAAVCPIDHPDVARATVFASYAPGSSGNPGSYGSGNSTILRGLDEGDVDVFYLGEDGTPSDVFEDVRYVRVQVNHTVTPLIPFFERTLTLPPFETTLPAESLGFIPNPDDPSDFECSCFGVSSTCSPGGL